MPEIVSIVETGMAENYDIMFAAGMVPLYVIGYPVALLLMRKKDAPVIEKHPMKLWQILLAFMSAYGLMIVGNLAGLVVTTGIGLIKGTPVQNVLLNVVTTGNIWISAIYIVLLAPLFEELLFRKLICDRAIKYGQGIAVIVSGLIFGLFHLNLNQFFYAFLLGCFFAYIYVRTGNVKYCIVLHMMVNFVGSVLGGLLLNNVDLQTRIGAMIFGLYGLCVYAIAITGIILLLVNKSKITLKMGAVTIEKGQRFKTVILNPGMLLYIVLCLAVMIVQALM